MSIQQNSPPKRLFAFPKPAYLREPTELYSAKFYGLCSIGGILACGTTHAAIVTLDVIKCRKQVNPALYKSIGDGIKKIIATDGPKGLVTGWAPTLIGYSVQGLCKFGFYEYFKKKYSDLAGEKNAKKYKDLLYLTASASAEVIADVALCPWEAVKVRTQTKADFPRQMRIGLPKILSEEGIGGLYKGLSPLWFRQVPYTMMKFWAFERTVAAIYQYAIPKPRAQCTKLEQLGVSFIGGYIAGVFCAIVSHPADVVVSKLNNVKTEGGTGTAIMKIFKELGGKVFYLGLGTRIIMIGTLTALQWFIYDSFKVYSGLPTTGASVPTPAKTAVPGKLSIREEKEAPKETAHGSPKEEKKAAKEEKKAAKELAHGKVLIREEKETPKETAHGSPKEEKKAHAKH